MCPSGHLAKSQHEILHAGFAELSGYWRSSGLAVVPLYSGSHVVLSCAAAVELQRSIGPRSLVSLPLTAVMTSERSRVKFYISLKKLRVQGPLNVTLSS